MNCVEWEVVNLHEMAILDNMLDVINFQMKEHNIKALKKVKIVVGELTGVAPDVLEFCWDLSIENSSYKEAILEVEKIKAVAICSKCTNRYLFSLGPVCNNCGGGVKEILSGRELYIDYIEGE